MTKLIFTIFLVFGIFLPQHTVAQNPIEKFWALNQNKLLLDQIKPTTASMAYSVRKLTKAYTGPAMKVRKGAGASAIIADVAFNATTGVVDANSVATIVSGTGTGTSTTFGAFYSGASVFVTTWYDQSGNARHVTQGTESKQPRIVNAGTLEVSNTRASIRFIGASATVLQVTVSPASVFGSSYIGTAAAVLEPSPSGTASTAFGYSPNTNSRWQCHINWDNGIFYFDVGNNPDPTNPSYGRISATNSNTGLGTYMMIASSTAPRLQMFINGVNPTPASSSGTPSALATSATDFTIGGATGTTSYYHAGHQSELIIFPVALTASNIEIVNRNQKVFYKTP